MATVTHAGSTWNSLDSPSGRTVVATPAAGDLIVVLHGISAWASGDDSTISDNQSGTYTKIGTATAPLSSGGGTNLAWWISVRNESATAVSHTFSQTDSGGTGGGLTVYRIAGMSRYGSSAIKQTDGESTQTENPPSLTFAAATISGNPVILGVLGEDNPPALTPPTGFTEGNDQGWATPTSGVETCFINDGGGGTTFAWSAGALTDHNECGIELDASAAVTPPPRPTIVLQAVPYAANW